MKDIKIEAENVILSSIFINSIMYMFTKYIIGVSINSTITAPNILNNLFFISIIQSQFTIFIYKVISLLHKYSATSMKFCHIPHNHYFLICNQHIKK
ncbi:Uncharacterised protein [Yersinia pseudotuberculosis]|uniref:Uncharacterized protein n=1 Tax=Yersinia pseudotuberculosis TaxID=633 RepID=A0A380QBU1_YERPU|nr:Uncharacterised protein [Yersinia pseudotuberculosis]